MGVFVLAIQLSGCVQPRVTDLTQTVLFPQPREVKAGGTAFVLDNSAALVLPQDAEAQRVARMFAEACGQWIGMPLNVVETDRGGLKSTITFALLASENTGAEGYRILVDENSVRVEAAQPAGLFYAGQTLLQMLAFDSGWYLPTGEVVDYPQYAYRGGMLDIARHFFSVEEIKRYIDHLAFYKLNMLHLHLSDDQGWRIEIKSWPNLTAHGALLEVGGTPGGFLTQAQYTELVEYAAQRFVTVIPEVDMPGHTQAALSSYPELSESGKPSDLYTGIEVGFSTLATRKSITYQFVDDVVRELAALTPGAWIHVGGDESLVTKDADYVYFMNKVQDIVLQHGKNPIGWDEFAKADLIPGSVVQYWNGDENARLAMQKGAQLIYSPAKYAYLDMKYDSTFALGLHWAGYIEVDKAYLWHPDTLVSGVPREAIWGVEVPLWTETLENMEMAEQMLFPRWVGFAELAWSNPEFRTWDAYRTRLAQHEPVLIHRKVNFYASPRIDWPSKTK